jgi:polysaccharide biosynthesis protein PslH
MRLFFLCQRVPYPPDRGDKISTYNLIVHLAKQHEVHVFCTADGTQDLANLAGLAPFAKSVTAVPVAAFSAPWRAARALATGAPLSVALLAEPRLHAAIKEKVAANPPDLFLVYSSNAAQFAEPFAGLPRIMHFCDLDSLKWVQFAERSRPPMKWIYAREARRLLAYERAIAASFSHSLVCTATEKRDFERLIPGRPVSVVGNGVDLDFFRSSGRTKRPLSMVFTGVMNYFPNVDAMCWFCDAILPLIQARLPAANLVICGARPAPAVRRLAQQRGVTVTGRVPDTRPYLDEAEIFVGPLRLARGIQNKLLEAMAMGLPCVSSSLAASATVIPNEAGILAASDAAGFAEHVVRLLTDGDYRATMAHRARAAVEEHYRWEVQLAALDRVIAGIVPRAAAFRSEMPVG